MIAGLAWNWRFVDELFQDGTLLELSVDRTSGLAIDRAALRSGMGRDAIGKVFWTMQRFRFRPCRARR